MWTDVSPGGTKSKDIGVGVGPMLCAWVTTEKGVYAWNGRWPNSAAQNTRLNLDWEPMAVSGARIAVGPDGCPWAVNAENQVSRLVAAERAATDFRTADVGKVTGTAIAADGALFQDEFVSINGSTDLSRVIVGNSGARVNWIKLERSPVPGVFYRLSIDGQGPSGFGSGWMYIYIEDEGGFTEYKGFFSSAHGTLSIDYIGKKAGIKRISWSAHGDPGKRR